MGVQRRRQKLIFLTVGAQIACWALLFAGLVFTRDELALLALFIIATNLLTRWWAGYGQRHVRVRSLLERDTAFPRDNVGLTLELCNFGFLPVWTDIHFGNSGGAGVDNVNPGLLWRGLLPWRETRVHRWVLVPERRGVLNLGPVTLSTADPLDLRTSESQLPTSHELFVYPAVKPIRVEFPPGRDSHGTRAARLLIKDPVHLLGTRDYGHASNARFIHWKASARRDTLQEKVFDASGQERVWLLIDVGSFRGENSIDDFERTLEAVASLAVHFSHRGAAVGFAASWRGDCPTVVRCGCGAAHLHAILKLLARLTRESDTSAHQLVEDLRNVSDGTAAYFFAHFDEGDLTRTRLSFLRLRLPVTYVLTGHAPGWARSVESLFGPAGAP